MNLSRSPRSLLACFALLTGGIAPAWAEDVQGVIYPIKQVSLSSPVLQEIIEAVLVEEGDVVTEGQVVVQLRKAKEELSMQEAQKLVENAEFVAKGTRSLADSKMGSKEQALKSQTELELAKIRLALAQEQLREKTVRATLAGTVVKKYKEAGESVDRVEKLIDVLNFDQVYVQFYLPPKLLQSLQPKQPITRAGARFEWCGLSGGNQLHRSPHRCRQWPFRIKVQLNNQDHKIKAGMKALADFTKRG